MRLSVENLEICIFASHLMINDTTFPLFYKVSLIELFSVNLNDNIIILLY